MLSSGQPNACASSTAGASGFSPSTVSPKMNGDFSGSSGDTSLRGSSDGAPFATSSVTCPSSGAALIDAGKETEKESPAAEAGLLQKSTMASVKNLDFIYFPLLSSRHPSRLAALAPQDDVLMDLEVARHPEVAAKRPSKGDARLDVLRAS